MTPFSGLELEHYPGFTEVEVHRLVQVVFARHDLLDMLVIHRVGAVAAGEAIVLVAALSSRRAAAFAAVGEIMDYLKTDAPIWKREVGHGRALDRADRGRSRPPPGAAKRPPLNLPAILMRRSRSSRSASRC